MAGLTPLASPDDVASALGRALTSAESARAAFVLSKLSAAFRAAARQAFAVERYMHRLKADGGRVWPTRAPLRAVHAVTTDDGTPLPYQVRHGFIELAQDAADGPEFVVVSYDAGLDTVPEEVRLQIADSARRVLSISGAAAEGATQVTETTGPFSESRQMASWAVGGQAILSPDDEALAVRYRPSRHPHVWVMAGA